MRTRPRTNDHETREYVLTRKGLDLQPVIIALTAWGDRWAAPQGPPTIYEHEGCGGPIHQHLRCQDCDATPAPGQVMARPGQARRQSLTNGLDLIALCLAADPRAALALGEDNGDRYEQARALAGLAELASEPGEAERFRKDALTCYTELGVPEAGQLRQVSSTPSRVPGNS